MSAVPEARKRRLTIETGLPTAEIQILDGLGVVQAQGVKRLSAALPCGFYRVRYLAGSAGEEEFVELPPGEGEFYHSAPILKVAVPAAPRTAAPKMEAMATSAVPGELYITLTFSSTSPAPLASPLTIRGIDGKQLGELSQESMDSGKGWLALSLDPGCYLLESSSGSDEAETIEQCAYVSSGWRTEALVPVNEEGAPDARKGVPDAGNAAVFIGKPEEAEVAQRDFDLAEMARQNLGAGVSAGPMLGEAAIREMLGGKFGNPMLGIYGAYLMLRGATWDRKLLTEVAGNLRGLIGDIPDVLALFLVLGDSSAGALEFRNPPMLRAAWQAIVDHGGVVPRGSYAARIAANLRGWGAWLQWKSPAEDVGFETAEAGEIDFGKLAELAAVTAPPPGLQPLEQILYNYLALNASQANEARTLARNITTNVDKKQVLGSVWSPVLRSVFSSDLEKRTKGAAGRVFQTASIASSLRIPQALVTAAGASLSKKLAEGSGWLSYLRSKF